MNEIYMDTPHNKTESLVIGNCISCQGLVRLPSTTSASSMLRCPHCSNSFPLQALLTDSIPEMEIITTQDKQQESAPYIDRILDKKSDTTDPVPREKFVVPAQLSKGAKRRRRRRSKDSQADNSRQSSSNPTSKSASSDQSPTQSQQSSDGGVAVSAKTGSQPGTSPNIKTETKRSSSQSRRKRSSKKANQSTEAAKILGGAVVAFPLAYLLILWVLNMDPLHLGPTLSNVVPFAIPAEFQGDREPAVVEDSEKTGSMDELTEDGEEFDWLEVDTNNIAIDVAPFPPQDDEADSDENSLSDNPKIADPEMEDPQPEDPEMKDTIIDPATADDMDLTPDGSADEKSLAPSESESSDSSG